MKKTKMIQVGNVKIGGGAPVSIQSMTTTDTRDINATVNQIKALAEAGCEIARCAVVDTEAAKALKEIKKRINIPLVADVHFDYRLALASIENGCDKLRINPGNIGGLEKTSIVVKAAKEKGIPIRIGVNAGSLEKDIYEKYGGVTAEGLVESALRYIEAVEADGFYDIVLAVKTQNVPMNIKAYRLLSLKTDYPLHIGVTEAGGVHSGSIRSAVGIGALLADGIGDTIRVSLTGDPLEEVKCAKEILKSLDLRKFGVEIISCPTCGRTNVNLTAIAAEIEKRCESVHKNIKVAVMGCAVNGPGEARDADLGVASGDGTGVIFKGGKVVRKVQESDIVRELMDEINKY